MISLVVSLIFVVYAGLILLLIVGWRLAIQNPKPVSLQDQPFISIIIAARNEDGNITSLLNDIVVQSYQHIEVIVVDDCSQDATADKVMQEMKKDSRIRLLKNDGKGKKQALTTGIKLAQGSIIITTDADCRMNATWIESLIPNFADTEIKMVFGGVTISGNSFFDDVQAIEFSSLIGSGAATSALGFPTMCNGANLAFRKEVFEEVGGYSGNIDIPSGDDEFLMRKIKAKYPKGIVFAGNREVVVRTSPSKDINEFIQQRIRWAGKWRHNQSATSVLLAIFIFCFQVSSIALPILIIFNRIEITVGVVLLLTKVMLELIFLQQVNRFLLFHWSWLAFILLQVLYPFYVVTIGLFSNVLSFSWKGRTLKSLTVNNNDSK